MLERLLLVERSEDLFVTVCDITDRAGSARPSRTASPATRAAAHRRDRRPRARTTTAAARPARRHRRHGAGRPRRPRSARRGRCCMFTDGLFEVRSRTEARNGSASTASSRCSTGLLADRRGDGDHLDRLLELVEASHGGPLDDDVALLAAPVAPRSVTTPPAPGAARRADAPDAGRRGVRRHRADRAGVARASSAWAFDRQVDARRPGARPGRPRRDHRARRVRGARRPGDRGARLRARRDPQFLDPVRRSGQRDQAAEHRGGCGALVAGDAGARSASRRRSTPRRRPWQRDAAPTRLIAAAQSDRGRPRATPRCSTGARSSSTRCAAATRALDDALTRRAPSARSTRSRRRRTRSSCSRSSVVALLVACAVVIWVGLRRLVLDADRPPRRPTPGG